MKKWIPLFIVLFASSLYAQDSTNKNNGTIYKKGNTWRMNGEKLSAKQFEAEIYKVPTAIAYYKKSKTSKTLAYSFIVPVALIAFLGDHNKYNSRDTVTGRTKISSYSVGLILSGGASLYFLFNSFSLFKKTVRARNSGFKAIY